MFRNVVKAIHNGRSPMLFTAIEGNRIGHTAVLDDETVYGDPSLIRTAYVDAELPSVQDGILIERITTPPHLILCGGGHVSVYVSRIAKMVGFRVTVIDEREDFANPERFPDADSIINLPFVEALDTINDPNAYYVIVTRGHQFDRFCLETILKKPYTYCGMIGSRSKIAIVNEALLKQGYAREKIESVHAPIGLSIGANTPEEIAVCIVGEMIQVKNSKTRGSEWDQALCDAIETLREPYAMVTLITKKGSAPRSTGARMIVKRDGTIISSVGGGFGEFEAAQHAQEMLNNHANAKRYTCMMNNTDAASKGMICGGVIDILIQIEED